MFLDFSRDQLQPIQTLFQEGNSKNKQKNFSPKKRRSSAYKSAVSFCFFRLFGMFRDVLRCFGKPVAIDSSPRPKKQPKTQRTIRWNTKNMRKEDRQKKRMT
jgi:hypothetical protein